MGFQRPTNSATLANAVLAIQHAITAYCGAGNVVTAASLTGLVGGLELDGGGPIRYALPSGTRNRVIDHWSHELLSGLSAGLCWLVNVTEAARLPRLYRRCW